MSARLHVSAPPRPVRAVALVLHGGREVSHAPARENHLAVLRMLPIARALRRRGGEHGLAVARLRFEVRGWNGAEQSPVADARAALDELGRRFPGVPVALVGHSMGGRTSIYAADHPAVTTVVGLAPWIEGRDPRATMAGRHVLFLHGTADTVTDPRMSARYVREIEPIAASASFISVTGEKHAMLGRPGVWNDLTVGYVLSAVCGVSPAQESTADGTADGETTNVLAMALAGRAALVV
ncbi:alpha/beta fold hydrolase [Jatrophihabitans sp.]|uniref:alpha/beta hydrolase n=1 Tax=Jatrophihabitans sp. TaxID=1932789 RepID=UPI0030C77123|nr:lysophospholipase [Jatrophihabitans sp.]